MPTKNIPNRKNQVKSASVGETPAKATTDGHGSPTGTISIVHAEGATPAVRIEDFTRQERLHSTLAEVARITREESGKVAEVVARLRELEDKGKQGEATEVKKGLPCYTPQSRIERKRDGEHFTQHSGYLHFDIDGGEKGGLPDEGALEKATQALQEWSHTVLLHTSPRGRGLKVTLFAPFLREGSKVEQVANHYTAHAAVQEKLEGWMSEIAGQEVRIDGAVVAPNACCFVSHDPGAFFRTDEEAEPITRELIEEWSGTPFVPDTRKAERWLASSRKNGKASKSRRQAPDSNVVTFPGADSGRIVQALPASEAFKESPEGIEGGEGESPAEVLQREPDIQETVLRWWALSGFTQSSSGSSEGVNLIRPDGSAGAASSDNSVTVYDGDDEIGAGWSHIWSDSTHHELKQILPADNWWRGGNGKTLTPFALYTAFFHGGNVKAANDALRERYGIPGTSPGREYYGKDGAAAAAEQQPPEQGKIDGGSSSQKYPQSLTYRQAREDEWYVALREGREMLQSASWRRRSEEEEKAGLPRREADYMAAMEEDPFSLLITPNTYIPPVRPLVEVVDGEGNDQRVANGGDMVALTGIPGSGKTSAAVAAISGALNPDSKEIGWGWKVHNPEDGAVIVFDTEQPTYAVRDRMKEIEGLTEGRTPYIWAIRGVSAHQRLRALCMAIAAVAEKHEGRIHTIVIDGVTDLAPTVNDEVMAKELVEFLGIVADELGCALFGIVHQNKQGQDPSPRGHIGQEFQRKSASVLGVTQVKGDPTHSVKCLHSPVGKLRHGILPYDLGPKAKYCKEAGRFVELDGELAKQLEESKDSAWDRVVKLFAHNPDGRLTQKEAVEVYQDEGFRKSRSSAENLVSADFKRMINEEIMDREGEKRRGVQYWLTPKGIAKVRDERGEVCDGVVSPW